MKNLRIAAVSYLNTIPFLYGIRESGLLEECELSLAVPSQCAAKLRNSEVDLALVPVGALPSLDGNDIVTDFCLGADGEVRSVLLLSNVPPSKVERVFLDTDSMTSVRLARILFMDYWETNPAFIEGIDGFKEAMRETDAAVVIGDKVFRAKEYFPYATDLASEWKKMTGLPFVFAVWLAKPTISRDFVLRLNGALAYGVANIEKALKAYPPQNGFPDPYYYLSNNIAYTYGMLQQESLKLFLECVQKLSNEPEGEQD